MYKITGMFVNSVSICSWCLNIEKSLCRFTKCKTVDSGIIVILCECKTVSFIFLSVYCSPYLFVGYFICK